MRGIFNEKVARMDIKNVLISIEDNNEGDSIDKGSLRDNYARYLTEYKRIVADHLVAQYD